jgi:hypothetical protein
VLDQTRDGQACRDVVDFAVDGQTHAGNDCATPQDCQCANKLGLC